MPLVRCMYQPKLSMFKTKDGMSAKRSISRPTVVYIDHPIRRMSDHNTYPSGVNVIQTNGNVTDGIGYIAD
jgi:hypothetical protein